MNEKFRKAAERISIIAGTPKAFLIAMMFVLVWAMTGPLMGFSDTWQLIINTGTTIVTFLMVFLIQNAQNRDSVAMQLKLDELIRAIHGARMGMLNLDELSDEELLQLRRQFRQMGQKYTVCAEVTPDSADDELEVTVQAKYTSKADHNVES